MHCQDSLSSCRSMTFRAQCLGVSLSCLTCPRVHPFQSSPHLTTHLVKEQGFHSVRDTDRYYPSRVVEALSKLQPSSHFFLCPTLSPVFTVLIPDRHVPQLHLSVCFWRTQPWDTDVLPPTGMESY